MLIAIDAPHFYAGVVLENDIVIQAAPILKKYMIGKCRDDVIGYCKRKGWKAIIVPNNSPEIEVIAMRSKKSGDVWFGRWAFGIKRNHKLVIVSEPIYETGGKAMKAGRDRLRDINLKL